jgi:pyruvate dehydrogenase E2 component (dihydrolipoamide acetyltransferase)
LSRKWKELVDKARAKQLQPHEYTTGTVISMNFPIYERVFQFANRSLISFVSPGTFTLSNLGMFGVDRFDAILPPGTVSNLICVQIVEEFDQ